MSVCVSVCPQGYIWNHTHNIYQIFVAYVAYVHGSALFRHVDDSRIAYWQEGVTGVHSAGEV